MLTYTSIGLWFGDVWLPLPSLFLPRSTWIEQIGRGKRAAWGFDGSIYLPPVLGGGLLMRYWGDFVACHEPFGGVLPSAEPTKLCQTPTLGESLAEEGPVIPPEEGLGGHALVNELRGGAKGGRVIGAGGTGLVGSALCRVLVQEGAGRW